VKKSLRNILFIGAFVFLFEFSYAPLLHNHAPDIYDHYDCPAFIISVTFVSFAINLFLASIFGKLTFQGFLSAKPIKHQKQISFNISYLRAPPF